MIKKLKIKGTMDEMEFLKLWQEPFVMQKMEENMIPVTVSTSDGNPLSEEKFREFCGWLNEKVIEHNERAEEYNKERNEL